MYIPIGAPDEMKLGTAMSLLRLLISEITARKVRFVPRSGHSDRALTQLAICWLGKLDLFAFKIYDKVV